MLQGFKRDQKKSGPDPDEWESLEDAANRVMADEKSKESEHKKKINAFL